MLFEDNVGCITQLRGSFIKGDRTKHISQKLFFTHDLQKNGDIDIQQIRSHYNLADLFSKSLTVTTLKKRVQYVFTPPDKDQDKIRHFSLEK